MSRGNGWRCAAWRLAAFRLHPLLPLVHCGEDAFLITEDFRANQLTAHCAAKDGYGTGEQPQLPSKLVRPEFELR